MTTFSNDNNPPKKDQDLPSFNESWENFNASAPIKMPNLTPDEYERFQGKIIACELSSGRPIGEPAESRLELKAKMLEMDPPRINGSDYYAFCVEGKLHKEE